MGFATKKKRELHESVLGAFHLLVKEFDWMCNNFRGFVGSVFLLNALLLAAHLVLLPVGTAYAQTDHTCGTQPPDQCSTGECPLPMNCGQNMAGTACECS